MITSTKYKVKTPSEVDAFFLDVLGNKRCVTCKEYKPMCEYHKNKSGRYGLAAVCKTCTSTKTKKYHAHKMASSPDYKLKKKQAYVKYRFGISLAEYNDMLLAQNHRCAICNTENPKGGWALDHDHSTGKIRSFLCNICNRGLGYFNDNPEVLMQAANYLHAHSKEGNGQ